MLPKQPASPLDAVIWREVSSEHPKDWTMKKHARADLRRVRASCCIGKHGHGGQGSIRPCCRIANLEEREPKTLIDEIWNLVDKQTQLVGGQLERPVLVADRDSKRI